MNISIFAKPAFLNTASNTPFISKEVSYKGNGHLQRVSSIIRGEQIANYLGVKLNPEKDYQNDICIYVKPHVKNGDDFKFEGKSSYLDIIDGWNLKPVLDNHPDVKVIACSKQDVKTLERYTKNKVVFIPQHHCNFERVRKNTTQVKTVGIIGTEDAFEYLPKDLEGELLNRNIQLLKYSKFFSRQDIVDFYMQIDIQIVWRPYKVALSNPLKIINAASFGIPTIAYRETVFQEVEGCYQAVDDLFEFLYRLDNLRNSSLSYLVFSNFCFRKAEEYHIDNVAKLYKELK